MQRTISHLAILFAVGHAHADEPSFHNVRIGLAKLETSQIYHEATTVPYQPNAMCTVAGKKAECMQWALEYAYSNVEPGSELKCSVNVSRPVKRVDVEATYEGTVQQIDGSQIIKTSSGHEFAPAYVVKEPDDIGVTTTTYKCSLNGVEVLRKEFSVNYGGL